MDTPDARITNDTDLLLQFLFEFVLGGCLGFNKELLNKNWILISSNKYVLWFLMVHGQHAP